MITLQNLSKNYYGFTLKEASITFETGKVIGILGACGSGKSTLLKCICDMTSYNGSISFDPKGTVVLITEEGSFFPRQLL